MKMNTLNSIARSEKNNRKDNEDAVHNNDELGIYILADGMHGYNGKESSNFCIEFLSEKIKKAIDSNSITTETIKDLIQECERNLDARYLQDIQKGRYGTTLDTVWFDKKEFHVFHVGDSRVYGMRKDRTLEQLTEDDRVGAKMVKQGILDYKDCEMNKFNKGLPFYQPQYEGVTNGIGGERLGDIFVKRYNRQDYNFILLTTDGITDLVTGKELEDILNHSTNIQKASDEILDRVQNPKGVIEFNMESNHYKLTKLFYKFQENPPEMKEFISLSDELTNIESEYEKAETIQHSCKKYPKLDKLFRNAIASELKEKDNASLIIIQSNLDYKSEENKNYLSQPSEYGSTIKANADKKRTGEKEIIEPVPNNGDTLLRSENGKEVNSSKDGVEGLIKDMDPLEREDVLPRKPYSDFDTPTKPKYKPKEKEGNLIEQMERVLSEYKAEKDESDRTISKLRKKREALYKKADTEETTEGSIEEIEVPEVDEFLNQSKYNDERFRDYGNVEESAKEPSREVFRNFPYPPSHPNSPHLSKNYIHKLDEQLDFSLENIVGINCPNQYNDTDKEEKLQEIEREGKKILENSRFLINEYENIETFVQEQGIPDSKTTKEEMNKILPRIYAKFSRDSNSLLGFINKFSEGVYENTPEDKLRSYLLNYVHSFRGAPDAVQDLCRKLNFFD